MAKIFKVSYVVRGGGHPGAILNETKKPKPGDKIILGEQEYQVIEVQDLLPARGEFNFLHATVEPVN